MVASINSLMNMEMQLYGGLGTNVNAPSYLNGYNASSYPTMPMFSRYNNMNNLAFGQNIPYNYGNMGQQAQPVQQVQQVSAFQGLTKKESDAIVNYYAKGLTPTQTLLGAAAGQAVFSVVNHPRLLVHPYNSIKTVGGVEKWFKSIKDPASKLGMLWQDPNSNELLREAYFQTHKAQARLKDKLGLFRSTYLRKIDDKYVNKDAVERLLANMKSALETGDSTKIAQATAELKHSYVNDGAYYRVKQSVKNFFTGKKESVLTVEEALRTNSKQIGETVKELTTKKQLTFLERMKKPGTVGGALFFAAINMLMSFGKIQTAFAKDKENEQKGISSNNGKKQLGQSVFKAAANAAGWTIGEAAGCAAFAKWGASIGTAFGPGVGTLIGGIVGFVAGGVGMVLFDKISNKIVGRDVADKIEAENLSKTPEGQVQLLQYTMQQAQAGKSVPVDVQQATQKLIAQYA